MVVSIIALLVALLLPSLRMAREAAWVSVCAASERQLTLAVLTYQADYVRQVYAPTTSATAGSTTYNGYFTIYSSRATGTPQPWGGTIQEVVWFRAYGSYLGKPPAATAAWKPPYTDVGARFWITALPASFPASTYINVFEPPWQRLYPYHVRSFRFNVGPKDGLYDTYIQPYSYSPRHRRPERALVTGCPVGSDAWRNAFSTASHYMTGNVVNLDSGSCTFSQMVGAWKGGNVALGDGHVQWVPSHETLPPVSTGGVTYSGVYSGSDNLFYGSGFKARFDWFGGMPDYTLYLRVYAAEYD